MNRTGVEPTLILKVEYMDDVFYFSNVEYTPETSPFGVAVLPYVEEFSEYSSVLRVDGFGSIDTITVRIADFYGAFKNAMESFPLQDANVTLYLVVKQPPQPTLVTPLLVGRFSDPIMWDELERRVDLGVVSNVIIEDFGFVPDWPTYQYLMANISEDPWPHVFGKNTPHTLRPICSNPNTVLSAGIVIQAPNEMVNFRRYSITMNSQYTKKANLSSMYSVKVFITFLP